MFFNGINNDNPLLNSGDGFFVVYLQVKMMFRVKEAKLIPSLYKILYFSVPFFSCSVLGQKDFHSKNRVLILSRWSGR